jgi:hypothetical protein
MSFAWYRNYSSDPHGDRVTRAFEQQLRLLQCKYYPKSAKWELRISSSTGGGYYDVMFNKKKGTCSCPDFERRRRPCKHMLCVLLRILKLKNHQFTTITQVGKSYDQITPAFLALFHRDEDEERNAHAKDENPVASSSTGVAPLSVEEETCLICLLEFVPDQTTISKCTSHCKRWLGHKECLDSWYQQSKSCPLCKGKQTNLTTSSAPSKKRMRNGLDDGVDIDALQAQAEDEDMVDANAFFQIIAER